MATEGNTAVSLPSSPINKNISTFSSRRRFLYSADNSNSSPTPRNHLELDESDLFWPPDVFSCGGDQPITFSAPGNRDRDACTQLRPFLTERFGLSAALADDCKPSIRQRRPIKEFHQSAPVNVPVWPGELQQPCRSLSEVDDGDGEETEDEVLPPHVIVARTHAMTFSVFEGAGRTLKGRDLRRVRNAVFQKTGFLD